MTISKIQNVNVKLDHVQNWFKLHRIKVILKQLINQTNKTDFVGK